MNSIDRTNPGKHYFEQVAGQWNFGDEVREMALAKAYLHPDMVAADVGAGTGYIASGLAHLVKKVHLLGSSAAMLEQARQKLAVVRPQFTWGNCEFHLADGLCLPLEEASVDTTFANMYLRQSPDPLAAIREMVRILRPGGRLVLIDLDADQHECLKTETVDVGMGWGRDQVREWFEQAGLVNVLVDCVGQYFQAGGDGQEAVSIGIFVVVGTKKIAAHETVQASYAARVLGADCGCESGCCSPGPISIEQVGFMEWNSGYSVADRVDAPAAAAEISLGCGNPLALAALKAGETVLDIGSGGGLDCFLAAKRVGPTGQVIGVDMTPSMLQRARKTAEEGGYTNVKFRHGYAEKLPVPDESVDVIISNCVINLSEDKGKVFREAFRVLRSGGRLEISDPVFSAGILPAERLSEAGWSECISGALPEGEYLDLTRQAGFTDISIRRSQSTGQSGGVSIYSVQLSAKKP